AGPALAALGRLRRAAATTAETADLTARMREDDGPEEVRQLAATLNAMLSRLERADADRREAHEATRAFAADAGHELRTPLTAVSTTVEALRRHPELPAAERTAMLEEVEEEQDRLVALLDALQALARGDAGGRLDRRPVDLVEIVEHAVAAARAGGPASATVVLDAPDDAWVHGWEPGLRTLADNLVRNALVHGRPDGVVTVTVTTDAGPAPHDQAGPPADDGASGARGGVVLTVDDDGPGIPGAERAAVLGRFARSRDAR
ncbi:sensor histidine kinase, partial [Patulibacter sp. S7RM1-6]